MKIGIMSFAHIHAEAYIENLKQIEEVELIGIADDNEERGKLYANRYGARFFYSYEALLNENPEGVLICSENVTHRPLVEIAAAAGVHVMCEKPLATTLEDGRAILRTCEKAGIILMTAFPMRFSPPIVETRDLLRKGGLGKIYCCNSRNQGQMPKHHREWFVDRKLAGGGAVADHTVHLADILRWFLDCEAKEVFARSNRLLHGDEVEVDGDYLKILGRRSEMINIGGEKVYPAEVESLLMELDNILDASVRGEPNAITGQMVVARVTLEESETPLALRKRIRAALKGNTASFKIPAKFEITENPLHSARYKKMRRVDQAD